MVKLVVLSTIVPEALKEAIRQEAYQQRTTPSRLMRNLLEKTFLPEPTELESVPNRAKTPAT